MPGEGVCVREKDKKNHKWQNTLETKRRLMLFHPGYWMGSLQQMKEAKCSTILSKFSFYAHTITCNYKPICKPRKLFKFIWEKSAYVHLKSDLQTWIKYYDAEELFSSTDSTNSFRSENRCLTHKLLYSFSNRSHLGATW